MTSTTKKHSTNTGIEVIGWDRYVHVSNIFIREFNPCVGSVVLGATYARDGNVWMIWVDSYSRKKPTTTVIEKYKAFLRGVIAASMYYDPYGDFDRKDRDL